MEIDQYKYVVGQGNDLSFKSLNHPDVLVEFIPLLKSDRRLRKHFILNFKEVTKAVYPNICTPLSGILEELTGKGFEFEYYCQSDYLKKLCLTSPKNVADNLDDLGLDRIWKFSNSEDIQRIVNSFTERIAQSIVCEQGVLLGLDWSLNEVMDNVLQHSTCNSGYVMAQVHRSQSRIAICVFDNGQGIYNSLKKSSHAPNTPLDALKICVKEGITRDKRVGQGNGLWGLHQIITNNSGILSITSNTAAYQLRGKKTSFIEEIPSLSKGNGGTIVDFQLAYNKEISVSKALGGHEPTNYQLESFEDDHGNVLFKLADRASGTGTRQSGQKLRNELINLYKQSRQSITIDFSGVNVSSSFADELLGKLVVEFGFYGFNNIFKLKNMNETVQAIVQRSVAQRMMEGISKPQ